MRKLLIIFIAILFIGCSQEPVEPLTFHRIDSEIQRIPQCADRLKQIKALEHGESLYCSDGTKLTLYGNGVFINEQ